MTDITVNSAMKDRCLVRLSVHLSELLERAKVSVDTKFSTFHKVAELPNGQINCQQLPIKGRLASFRVMELPRKEGDVCPLAIQKLLQDCSHSNARSIYCDWSWSRGIRISKHCKALQYRPAGEECLLAVRCPYLWGLLDLQELVESMENFCTRGKETMIKVYESQIGFQSYPWVVESYKYLQCNSPMKQCQHHWCGRQIIWLKTSPVCICQGWWLSHNEPAVWKVSTGVAHAHQGDLLVMRIASMYTKMPGIPWQTWSINHWNV